MKWLGKNSNKPKQSIENTLICQLSDQDIIDTINYIDNQIQEPEYIRDFSELNANLIAEYKNRCISRLNDYFKRINLLDCGDEKSNSTIDIIQVYVDFDLMSTYRSELIALCLTTLQNHVKIMTINKQSIETICDDIKYCDKMTRYCMDLMCTEKISQQIAVLLDELTKDYGINAMCAVNLLTKHMLADLREEYFGKFYENPDVSRILFATLADYFHIIRQQISEYYFVKCVLCVCKRIQRYYVKISEIIYTERIGKKEKINHILLANSVFVDKSEFVTFFGKYVSISDDMFSSIDKYCKHIVKHALIR